MIQRVDKNKLKQLASKFRVVAVLGPRQSGKTTICRTTIPRKPYVSLENPDIAEFATADPNGFLNQFKNGATLDEVQKLPHLFSYILQIVDAITFHYLSPLFLVFGSTGGGGGGTGIFFLSFLTIGGAKRT